MGSDWKIRLLIIDRYREVTISWGYAGDSIVNSLADIVWMIVGFFIAIRLPWKATLVIALIFEVFVGLMIRDNLALNILMLTAPLESVKEWQAGARGYWVTGKTKLAMFALAPVVKLFRYQRPTNCQSAWQRAGCDARGEDAESCTEQAMAFAATDFYR